MCILRKLLLLALVIFATSCSRGPDTAALIVEVQQRLDQQFSDNLFHITTLTRKGSTPMLDGADGLYVYYNLDLEFQRDYNLISWRGLNLGTLAEVLGATTSGIEGLDSGGNKKGDDLQIRGRIGYQLIDNVWVVAGYTPVQQKETIVPTETLDIFSPDALLDDLRQLFEHTADTSRSKKDRVTLRELRRSLSRIELGHARLDGFHTMGTGWPSGSYFKFGEAYETYALSKGFKIHNYASEGSLENGYQLNTGGIEFALMQSDVAEVLYKGWMEEGQLPSPEMRAIASLWPEAIHIITLEGSAIKKIADLKDKKIAIGSLHSGTRFTAARIWLAAGFKSLDRRNISLYGRGNSIKALESGEVDAVIIAGAIPDPAVQALAQRRSDIRFISVDQSIISKMTEQNFAYYGLPIPAKTYPGQEVSVVTLGMAALMVTSAKTPDDVVYQYMRLMREGVDEMAQTFYRAGFISYKTARLGISMPLHPAAKKYYADFQGAEEQKQSAADNIDVSPASAEADTQSE